MIDNTKIQTTKEIYPQIYAYTLPTIPEKDGWIKIGYTTRQDVDRELKSKYILQLLDYSMKNYGQSLLNFLKKINTLLIINYMLI